MFTYWPAYAAFAERERGAIARGLQADLSVFSVDLMTAPPEAILQGKALLTVVGGKIVYRSEDW
jgi:predicted amidohydrolase YtcJ